MAENKPLEAKPWHLEPESEYRFELDPGTSLAIKLAKGHAEIFGFELAEGKTYLFGFECKAAVYTWKGCVIEMSDPSTEYVSSETPMRVYGNLHLALEQMRVRSLALARKESVPPPPPPSGKGKPPPPTDPPRVLVLGPEHAGKTTLCKILANYAVRAGQGWTPFVVNVDPSEGAYTLPGTLSVAPIRGPIPTSSAANPLGSAATTAPLALASNALIPLAYWYGHAETKRNPLLVDRLIRNLGENVLDRCEGDAVGRASGIIVDTPSSFATGPASTSAQRHKLIKACIDAFRINLLLIVGHEKLNVEMQRTYSSTLTVVKIPKSGGVVELDYLYRERVHTYAMHTYMYGVVLKAPQGVNVNGPGVSLGGESVSDLVLSPSSSVVGFGELVIYRIGSDAMAPSDALPVGAARTVSEMQPVLVDPASPGSGLLNAVLALLAPKNPDENEQYDEEILDLPVVGFLMVTNIDMEKRKLTILAPNRGSFTGRTAVVGSYEWQDQ